MFFCFLSVHCILVHARTGSENQNVFCPGSSSDNQAREKSHCENVLPSGHAMQDASGRRLLPVLLPQTHRCQEKGSCPGAVPRAIRWGRKQLIPADAQARTRFRCRCTPLFSAHLLPPAGSSGVKLVFLWGLLVNSQTDCLGQSSFTVLILMAVKSESNAWRRWGERGESQMLISLVCIQSTSPPAMSCTGLSEAGQQRRSWLESCGPPLCRTCPHRPGGGTAHKDTGRPASRRSGAAGREIARH